MVLATNKGNDLTYLGNLVLNLAMSVVRESEKSEIWWESEWVARGWRRNTKKEHNKTNKNMEDEQEEQEEEQQGRRKGRGWEKGEEEGRDFHLKRKGRRRDSPEERGGGKRELETWQGSIKIDLPWPPRF